jgi:hypothetical protein
MPDTAITDGELLRNAETKARRLGLNSFIVWNVDTAIMWLQGGSGDFAPERTWPSINIRRRADVAANHSTWVSLLHQIIDDLNDLLDYGQVSGTRPEVAMSDSLLLDYLNQCVPALSEAIRDACARDADFEALVRLWWVENEIEHPGCTLYEGIARVNLVNWINRIVFAHYLKRFYNAAGAVESIHAGTSIEDAITIFNTISESCDFMNVFQPLVGQEHLDAATWDRLIELNCFLKDYQLASINQASFHSIIDSALTFSRKKLAGQFSTPKPLAGLLVRLTIRDRNKPIIDPCCGTGTIARAAYDLKRSVGIDLANALASTWASDKFEFPLQLCSIALSDPEGMGEVVQAFRKDAFDLMVGQKVLFVDPDTGAGVTKCVPVMHAVVSNLPFVRFEDIEILNPDLASIRNSLAHDCIDEDALGDRADLYAYLILKLRDLVEDNGRIGVITSNSWLATDWGQKFRDALMNCCRIRQVVISGEGRWFSSSQVVTMILILEKRVEPVEATERISFITTTNRIESWETQEGGLDLLASSILAGVERGDGFTKQEYTEPQIRSLESIGVGWNAFFVDLGWVSLISASLIPANMLFSIHRGERRGWDKLFFPEPGHGIEPQYIKPVLRSARDASGLIANPSDEAFCCSDSIESLTAKGMNGALAWISRFRNAVNLKGKPLPEVLTRSGCQWYEMDPTTMADLVISMNPDQRLCVHRLAQRSFVNQRLIMFTTKPGINIDVELCHALMNSVIGMFLIEAIGFGRGLGALDLNATKLSRSLHVLNPHLVSEEQRRLILDAFAPMLRRDVLSLPNELESPERNHFDRTVLKTFGVVHLQERIYDSLRYLFYIRQTART